MTNLAKRQLTTVRKLPHEGEQMSKKEQEQIDKTVEAVANGAETKDQMEKGKSTALVHWKDRMMAVKTQAAEAEKPQGGFISFKGGRMTYGDELLPGDKLNCVIVDYRFENDLYMTKFVQGVTRSPDCYAIARPGEVLRANPECDDPQGGVDDHDCETCEWNQWGSAGNIEGNDPNSRGKGCKTSRRIMVIAADDAVSPEKIAKAQVVTLIPPATSVDNFQTCMNQITKVLDTAPFGAVVEISVKPHPKFLFAVHFKVLQQITNDDLMAALTAKYEKESSKEIKYPKNSEREGGGAPPKQSGKY